MVINLSFMAFSIVPFAYVPIILDLGFSLTRMSHKQVELEQQIVKLNLYFIILGWSSRIPSVCSSTLKLCLICFTES